MTAVCDLPEPRRAKFSEYVNATCYSYNRTVSIAEVDEFFGETTVYTETESIDEEEAVRLRREEKKLKEKQEREEREKELHGENYDYEEVRDIKKAPTLFWGSEEEVAKTAGLEEPIQDEESSSSDSEDSALLEDIEIDSDISYGRASQEASDSGKGKGSKEKSRSDSRILKADLDSHLSGDALQGRQNHRTVRRLFKRNDN